MIDPIPSALTLDELLVLPTPPQSRPVYSSGDNFYNPEDYGWDYDETFEFPPGVYFLGDLFYALTEDQNLQKDITPVNSAGEIDGIGPFVHFWATAGGSFIDEEGYEYDCPTGTLGVISVAHLPIDVLAALKQVGLLVRFEEEFHAMSDTQGNFTLGWNWIFCGDESPLDQSQED
jgi:hypothetical protein